MYSEVLEPSNKWNDPPQNYENVMKDHENKWILLLIRIVISPIINSFLNLRKLNIWLKENQGKYLIGSKSMQYFINAIDHLSTLFCLWFHVQCSKYFMYIGPCKKHFVLFIVLEPFSISLSLGLKHENSSNHINNYILRTMLHCPCCLHWIEFR